MYPRTSTDMGRSWTFPLIRLRALSLGAGVQSTALALMAAQEVYAAPPVVGASSPNSTGLGLAGHGGTGVVTRPGCSSFCPPYNP